MHQPKLCPLLCLSLALMLPWRPTTAAPPAAPDAAAPVTAIRAGKLIDVEAGRALSNQIILIRGTKIERVGASVTIPEGAKVIDLSNMTVLPGLVDKLTPNGRLPTVAELSQPEGGRSPEKASHAS